MQTVLLDDELLQRVLLLLLSDLIAALYDNWLSPTASKASMLSQACLHVAVMLNFELWLAKFNPIILELFFFFFL